MEGRGGAITLAACCCSLLEPDGAGMILQANGIEIDLALHVGQKLDRVMRTLRPEYCDDFRLFKSHSKAGAPHKQNLGYLNDHHRCKTKHRREHQNIVLHRTGR